MKLSVVVTVYNELKNIRPLIDRINGALLGAGMTDYGVGPRRRRTRQPARRRAAPQNPEPHRQLDHPPPQRRSPARLRLRA